MNSSNRCEYWLGVVAETYALIVTLQPEVLREFYTKSVTSAYDCDDNFVVKIVCET